MSRTTARNISCTRLLIEIKAGLLSVVREIEIVRPSDADSSEVLAAGGDDDDKKPASVEDAFGGDSRSENLCLNEETVKGGPRGVCKRLLKKTNGFY